MKLQSFASLLTGLAIALNAAVTVAEPVNKSEKYFCADFDGIPRTFSRTERGPLMMISWLGSSNEESSPKSRCVEVSRRFQRFHDHGLLRYLGTGFINSQPVLCAIREQGDACNEENLLIALPEKTDPIQAARQLLDTRSLASGKTPSFTRGNRGTTPPLPIGYPTPIEGETYTIRTTYYDLEVLEENREAIIEENLTPIDTY